MSPMPSLADQPVTLDRAPIYAVLFDGTVDLGEYTPLVVAPYGADARASVPHGLDHEVVAALPGLWYCLHLPNAFFALIDIPSSALLATQSLDLGHHILLVPMAAFAAQHMQAPLAQGVPVLAVCPDELIAEATERCASLGFAMPPAPYSELSNESLEAHWRTIYDLVETDEPYLGRTPHLSHSLQFAPADLPRRWLARQLDDAEDIRVETGEPDQDVAIYHALNAQVRLRVAAQLEESEHVPEVDDAMLAEARTQLRVPVTLAAPGVAATYIKNAYSPGFRAVRATDRSTAAADTWTTATDGWNDATAELSAIRFLITHRAMARSGVGITLPPVPSEAFGLLAQLEKHMRTPQPTGKGVARLLDRLADATAHFWTPAVSAAVARASALTAFSNFPLGLLRLPGDSAPLSASVPITYRPLLPLTRAVQAELSYVPLVDLSERVKVLFAECIPGTDPVGALSRRSWEAAQEIFAHRAGERIVIDLVETPSAGALRKAIDAHRPDIIIISAHGAFSSTGNVAGLSIGDEIVLGPGLGPLPPVVILSACHVAPRGAGTVSVVDLLLREGAIAVLGTQVPVNVWSNMLLTARLLANIAEVLAGNVNYGENLLQVWRHVQSGNAVLDILAGSKLLNAWGQSPTPTGRTVLEEFMTVRSVGRLHTGDIYAHTEVVLGAIADDMGVGDSVRNWFRTPGYVPESLFYAFAGSPERIHLQTPGVTRR
jgi:hypothetical protein